jgi:hypothetical protein
MEPYILVIMILSASSPPRITNVDSIRFDSAAACANAQHQIDARNAEFPPGSSLNLLCVPARSSGSSGAQPLVPKPHP